MSGGGGLAVDYSQFVCVSQHVHVFQAPHCFHVPHFHVPHFHLHLNLGLWMWRCGTKSNSKSLYASSYLCLTWLDKERSAAGRSARRVDSCDAVRPCVVRPQLLYHQTVPLTLSPNHMEGIASYLHIILPPRHWEGREKHIYTDDKYNKTSHRRKWIQHNPPYKGMNIAHWFWIIQVFTKKYFF